MGQNMNPSPTCNDHSRRVRRWIVRVDEVWMPGAHILYPNSDDVGTGNARGQMEGKEGKLVLWVASRMRKRPTSSVAPVPGAVEHGIVQIVGDAIGTPGGGTEQDEGQACPGGISSDAACTTSGDSDPLLTTPLEDFFSGRLTGMEKLSFAVAGGSKDKEENGGEYRDPTAGLGSPGGGGVGYGAVADDNDISDVEVIEMNDIEGEADGDYANAAPEKGKGKSRSRKKKDDEFRLGEYCIVLPAAEVLLCAFALHILSPASSLSFVASIARILSIFFSCPIPDYKSSYL